MNYFLLLCIIIVLKCRSIKQSIRLYEVSHIPALMNRTRACLHVVKTWSTNTLLTDYSSQNKLLHLEKSNAVIS